MSASHILSSQTHRKPVVAIFGGDGRHIVSMDHVDIETFASRREGGNGPVRSLLGSIASERLDAVVFLISWLGHSAQDAVKAACEKHGVQQLFSNGAASSAEREIEKVFPSPEPAPPRPVVLVDLYWTRDKDPRVPLGHASLLSALRDAGVPATSIVRPVNGQQPDEMRSFNLAREIAETARELGPETIVAIGAYVWAEHLIQPMLPAIRAYGFDGDIVMGGPQISYSGAGLEETYPDADIFVRGYGEQALVDLAKGVDDGIPGVHRAGEPDIVEQAKVQLSELPSPFEDGTIPLEGQRFIRWETQRGCPYRCSFCQHREAGARLEWTDLEIGRLRREIALFVEAEVEEIAVLDPIFNVGENAIPVLKEFVEHRFQGKLSLQCRPEQLTDEFLELAAQLNVCLEFGLQTIHKAESKAVNRANNMRKVDEALDKVRELGLEHEVTLIFGLPEQTMESFFETVQWCLEREVPVIKAFPLLLLRGTSLDEDRERWAFETTAKPMGMVVASKTFDRAEWQAMARVSEALKKTEGTHPDWDALLALANQLEADVDRWVASFEGF